MQRLSRIIIQWMTRHYPWLSKLYFNEYSKLMRLTVKFIAISIRVTCGRTLSHVSTSLLNLLRILPNGVVSKKTNGKRMTLWMRAVCIAFAAAIVPSENIMAIINCDITALWQQYFYQYTMMTNSIKKSAWIKMKWEHKIQFFFVVCWISLKMW